MSLVYSFKNAGDNEKQKVFTVIILHSMPKYEDARNVYRDTFWSKSRNTLLPL